uniref:fibronectin-like isoform X2 n=1 Tax=Styela clava TaxID=7725 RepID=UPI0019398A11|nr:fibronectin-like isoform X2 [Styela clava]
MVLHEFFPQVLIFTSITFALDPPSNVTVTSIITDTFRVHFNQSTTAISHEVKVQAKLLSEDIHLVNSSDNAVQITGLQSNVIYDVTVRSRDSAGSVSNYTEAVQAKTYPSGVQVIVSEPTQTVFTAFLEVVAGAREWSIQLLNQRTNVTQEDIVNTTYKIYKDLDADTTYSIRARVSKLDFSYLSETQSPYGNWTTATTKKLSLFGRVVLLGQSVLTVDQAKLQEWEKTLFDEYVKIQPQVFSVKQLEDIKSTSDVLFHHEIFVNGTAIPDLTTFQLNNSATIKNSVVVTDVNNNTQYGIYVDAGDLTKALQLHLHDDVAKCGTENTNDWRSFTLNRNDGKSSSINLITNSAEHRTDTNTIFKFNDIKLFDPHSESIYTNMQPNSLYSIDQHYLIKMCQSSDKSSYLYSRRHGALFGNEATLAYKNTFVHSTGPSQVDVSKITYEVSGDKKSIILKMRAIYRAHSYKFLIDGVSEVNLGNLDSSRYVEATLGGLSAFKEYCADVSYTINHPDWTQGTSSPTCYQFYSGSPNTTSIRIVDVRSNSFKVSYRYKKYATSYIIKLSNETKLRKITTDQNFFVVNSGIEDGMTYNVSVATQNPFGVSEFSNIKSTKFWSFHDITNNSIRLKWDNESTDFSYNIGVLETGQIYQSNTNDFLISSLDPGKIYAINVTAIQLDESSLLLFTDSQITVPAIPTYLRISSKSEFKANIEWNSMDGVEEYLVDINGRGVIESMNTSLLSADFTGLLSGAKYTIGVATRNAAGKSDRAVIEVLTHFAVPVNLSTTLVSSTSIDIKWSGINGANSYTIRAVGMSNGTEFIKDVNSSTPSVNIQNLLPGLKYTITVFAKYDEGDSNNSETHYQFTVPDKTTNLALISREETSLGVAWESVVGADIYRATIPGVIINTTQTTALFPNLLPNKGYDVEIYAINSAGQGSGFSRKFFTVFQSPLNLTTSNVTTNSFLVNWIGSTDAKKFVVTTAYGSFLANATSITSPVNVTGLTPGTLYNFSVVAIYEEGKSEPSGTVQQITVPDAPTNLRLVAKEETSLTIAWNPTTGAELYKVTLEGAVQRSQTTTNTSMVFQNLLPNRGYTVKVFGVNSAGQSIGGQDKYKYFTVFQTPENVTVTSVQSESFLISWNGSTDAIKFIVTMTSAKLESNTTHLLATGLKPGSNQSIIVYAIYSEGESGPTKTIYQLTAPGTPTNLRYLHVAQNSLKIGWNLTSGADYYMVNLEGHNKTVMKTGTDTTFFNLTAGTKYNVSVRAHNQAGFSGIAKTTFETIPSNPIIETSSANNTHLYISWSAPKGATQYRVEVTLPGGSPVTGITGAGIVSNVYAVIGGLNPNLKYVVRVSAISSAGESPTSQPLTVDPAPPPPSNVILLGRTSTSLKMRWDIDAKATRCEITMNGQVKVFTTNTGNFNDLVPGTKYLIVLIAMGSGGRRSNSTVVEFQTLPSSPTPETGAVTTTSIRVSWKSMKGAEKYKIKVTSPGKIQPDLITNETALQIGNLMPGTQYTINCTSVLGTETSSPWKSIQAATLCLPPSGVNVTSVTHNSLSIEWNPSQGASEYNIIVVKLEVSKQRRRRSTSGSPKIEITSTSAKVSNLNPGSDYSISVVAVNSAGRSVSPGKSIKTGAGNPAKLLSNDVTTSSVMLEWAAQHGATRYMVYYRESGSGNTTAISAGTVVSRKIESLKSGISYEFSLATVSVIQPGAKYFLNTADTPNVTVITVPRPPIGLAVSKSIKAVKVMWEKSVGGVLYFVHVKWSLSNSTYNTTGNSLNLTMEIEKNVQYLFTVSAVNSQGRFSSTSEPVIYKVDEESPDSQSQIPWWVWLIVCVGFLIIIIPLLIFMIARKRQKSREHTGFYDVQNGNGGNGNYEIPIVRLDMNKSESDDVSRFLFDLWIEVKQEERDEPQTSNFDHMPIVTSSDNAPILSTFSDGSAQDAPTSPPPESNTDETCNVYANVDDTSEAVTKESDAEHVYAEAMNKEIAKQERQDVVEHANNSTENQDEPAYASVNKNSSKFKRKNKTSTFRSPENNADGEQGRENPVFVSGGEDEKDGTANRDNAQGATEDDATVAYATVNKPSTRTFKDTVVSDDKSKDYNDD